jgi:hypothetical protein
VSVPVSVRNRIWNECEISSSLEDFTDEYDVVLEDKEEGHYVNLRKSSYTYTPSVLGVEDDRFVLHLTKKANVSTNIFQQAEEDKKSGVDCVSGNGELFVNIEVGLLSNSVNRGEIEIFNSMGRKLVSHKAVTGQNKFNLAGGQIYIVRFNMGNFTTTNKVAIR